MYTSRAVNEQKQQLTVVESFQSNFHDFHRKKVFLNENQKRKNLISELNNEHNRSVIDF